MPPKTRDRFNQHNKFGLLKSNTYLTYKEARKHLNDPYVNEIVEERHITLGWQHAANVEPVVKQNAKNSIGRYVQSLQAIPIAIRKIVITRPIFIIEDHECMHLDVSIHMIAFVFSCNLTISRPLKCKAVMINSKNVIGQLYNVITIVNRTTIPNLKKGDDFEAYFEGIQFNGNLVQLVTRSNKRQKYD